MKCRELIELIEQGDKEAALKLVRQHMRDVSDAQHRYNRRRAGLRAQPMNRLPQPQQPQRA